MWASEKPLIGSGMSGEWSDYSYYKWADHAVIWVFRSLSTHSTSNMSLFWSTHQFIWVRCIDQLSFELIWVVCKARNPTEGYRMWPEWWAAIKEHWIIGTKELFSNTCLSPIPRHPPDWSDSLDSLDLSSSSLFIHQTYSNFWNIVFMCIIVFIIVFTWIYIWPSFMKLSVISMKMLVSVSWRSSSRYWVTACIMYINNHSGVAVIWVRHSVRCWIHLSPDGVAYATYL